MNALPAEDQNAEEIHEQGLERIQPSDVQVLTKEQLKEVVKLHPELEQLFTAMNNNSGEITQNHNKNLATILTNPEQAASLLDGHEARRRFVSSANQKERRIIG